MRLLSEIQNVVAFVFDFSFYSYSYLSQFDVIYFQLGSGLWVKWAECNPAKFDILLWQVSKTWGIFGETVKPDVMKIYLKNIYILKSLI